MSSPESAPSDAQLAPAERAGSSPGLSARHIRFIALGGAIGAGLFLGSGASISKAGPALLIAYAAAGTVIFLMARALGELALYKPVTGSFSAYAHELLGPWAGFVTGWSYWLIWILVGAAEITGIGVLMRHWYPDLPQWIPALIAASVLYVVNITAVSSFGELEFWLSLTKVVTIIALLVFGVVLLVIGPTAGTATSGVANLWSHGGFLPHGWHGVLDALPVAIFAFGGLEIIGLTAAETADLEKALPKAINGVAYRILLFYIGSLAIIMMLYPWNRLDSEQSPFILVLDRSGFPAAASVINVVVISALLSSCSSGIFGSSRMLHALATNESAPAWLKPVSARRVPARCVTACATFLLAAVALNYVFPDRVFGYLMTGVSALLLWTWGIIMLCHLAYRRKVARGEAAAVSFKLPAAPYTNWLVLSFIALVAGLLALSGSTRLTFYVMGGWFVVVVVAHLIVTKRKARASGFVIHATPPEA